ncbi:MAG TPA: TRAP transporter permease, partial [Chromatiales bacterium]|nr:TRAP transporter permease [Chromatiales bacterium]
MAVVRPVGPEIVEAVEHGGRRLSGLSRRVVLGTAILWSLFQLWVASPLPYMFGFGLFNDTEIRSLHLAFALFLVYLSFPWQRGAITERIPAIDWLL